MRENIFLEKPIDTEDKDLFDVIVHVEQLQDAIDEGAKFIAIDGEHGSGKSSIVNILKSKEELKERKSKFVNINFLNINEHLNTKNANEMNETINNYHRYFVNQVANDICKNPFEIEKIFYHNFISYSVTNPSKYTLWRKVVDKLLLIGTAYMVIYIAYISLFENVKSLQFFFTNDDKIIPIVLMVMFVLVIIYGYGIFKPDKQETSPMLDIDKCRNNFCKIVNTSLERNMISNRKEKARLYLIIDDLDRIDPVLQVKIISLLFNEYYPLDTDAELIFIFMIDNYKIKDNLKECNLDPNKLFDYIVPVSNNQKHIIRHLVNKMIGDNTILERIFSSTINKEYLVNLICKNYKTIRNIKHFFNKIITKEKYLLKKQVETINYDELIFLNIMLDLENATNLDLYIALTLNNEVPSKDLNISGFIEKEIKNACNKNILGIDYYIYLYNFIDISNLLNKYENDIYQITEEDFEDISKEDIDNIINNLDNGNARKDKVYYEIYKHLENDKRMIFIGSRSFSEYLLTLGDITDNLDIVNAYKNKYSYFLCDNFQLTTDKKNKMLLDLKSAKENYIAQRTSQNETELKTQFISFLENMNNRIINFELEEYFLLIAFDNTIFDLLFESIEYNKFPIGLELFNKGIISYENIKEYIDLEFIKNVDKLKEKDRIKIKQIILNNTNDLDLLINLLTSDDTFNNVENVYDKIKNQSKIITYTDLRKILDKYSYNEKLDKYILYYMEDKTWSSLMVNHIRNKKYNLSMAIINKFDSLNTKYIFNSFYEQMFVDEQVFKPYIYSQMQNDKKFKVHTKFINDTKYREALINVYKNVGNFGKDYTFTTGYSNFILSNFDFENYDFSKNEFWKITKLINNAKSITDLEKVLKGLQKYNKLEDFYKYCAKKDIDVTNQTITYLQGYSNELGITSGIKGSLTRKSKIIKPKKQSKIVTADTPQ